MTLRVRRTLKQTVELALHPRLLRSGDVAGQGGTLAPAIADLFPLELEAALDRTVAEFHSRPRANRAPTAGNVGPQDQSVVPDSAHSASRARRTRSTRT